MESMFILHDTDACDRFKRIVDVSAKHKGYRQGSVNNHCLFV